MKLKKSIRHYLKRAATVFSGAAFYENIVVVQAIGLCPIVAVGTHLQHGVALTVCTAAVLLPCSVLMALTGRILGHRFRAPIYTILAMGMLVLFAWAMDSLYPDLYARLILFLPLMAVTTIFAFRAEEFSVEHHPILAAVDAIGSAFGFGLVICAVSAVRELIGFGTLWNIRVIPEGYQFPQLIGMFAGFILLGFFAAVVQGLLQLHRKLRRQPQEEEDAA